jgi:DNA replication protein DnaD
VTVICGQMPANDGHMTDNGGHPLSSAPVFEYEYEYENEKRECAHAREGSGDDSHSSPSPIVKIWEQEARSVLNPAQFAKLERAFIGENALDPTALPEAIKLCKERIGRITPEYTTGILMNWREERMRMQTERKRTRDEPPAASSARDPTPDEVSSSPANDPVYLSWLEQYYAALREERKKREKEAG